MCLGNSRDNFQLHKFTTSENITKSFFFLGGGYFFDSHCILYWARAGCSAYDNEAHQGDNSSNDSDDERYERSVLEQKLATSAPATAVVGSQHSLRTSTSPGGSLRSNASSTGSARRSTGSKTSGKRQFTILQI